jgi:hypothetical protein
MNISSKLSFHFAQFISQFKREEKGSIAIETVILVPMLFWVFLTTFSIFHAYRQHSISQKAGYTIGDLISRQTEPLDQAFLSGSQRVLQFLTLSELSDTSLRVSAITYDEDQDRYEKDWSQVKGSGRLAFTDQQVEDLGDRLPIMKDNEQIILVETWIDYDPPFDIGLARHDVVNFIFTRPRYTPQVCWESCG